MTYTARRVARLARAVPFLMLVALTAVERVGGVVQAQSPPLLDVPFEVHENHVYLEVMVGGEAEPFLLDSGASVHAIDAGLAHRLGLEVADAGRIQGANGEMIDMGRTSVALRVGALRVPGDRVVVLPLDSVIGPFEGRRIAGIVGVPLLRQHVVRLDFGEGRLHLWAAGARPEELEAAAAAGVVLPVLPEPGLPMVEVAAELPDAGGRRLRLVVDLGAKMSVILGSPYVREQRLLAAIADAPRVTVGAGVSGETRVAVARIPALRLGEFVVREPVVGFGEGTQFPFERFHGLLGTALLKRFTVWFDLPGGRLVLEPLAAAREREIFDRSGAAFRHGADAGSTIIVHRVAPDGPAAQAGVRAGDVLVAIDGGPPASLASVRTRLRAPLGTEVAVVVMRDGVRSRHTIVLREIV